MYRYIYSQKQNGSCTCTEGHQLIFTPVHTLCSPTPITLGPQYPSLYFLSTFSPLPSTAQNTWDLLTQAPCQSLSQTTSRFPHYNFFFTVDPSPISFPPPQPLASFTLPPLFLPMLMNSVTHWWHIYKMCFWCRPMMTANYPRPRWFMPDLYDLISQVWSTCITCR